MRDWFLKGGGYPGEVIVGFGLVVESWVVEGGDYLEGEEGVGDAVVFCLGDVSVVRRGGEDVVEVLGLLTDVEVGEKEGGAGEPCHGDGGLDFLGRDPGTGSRGLLWPADTRDSRRRRCRGSVRRSRLRTCRGCRCTIAQRHL